MEAIGDSCTAIEEFRGPSGERRRLVQAYGHKHGRRLLGSSAASAGYLPGHEGRQMEASATRSSCRGRRNDHADVGRRVVSHHQSVLSGTLLVQDEPTRLSTDQQRLSGE